MAMTETDAVILDVAEAALVKVLEIRAAEDDADELVLRVEVTGESGVDYSYDLAFESRSSAEETDLIYKVGELDLMVPENSIDRLRGATLDLPSNPMQGGLVIRNPNRPAPKSAEELDLTGTIEEKIEQLLELRINPALAAHGGAASLVRVEDNKAYISMGGGCQGCSMSMATLRDGIAVMVTDALPEIEDVIDVTDHSEGENPYYD